MMAFDEPNQYAELLSKANAFYGLERGRGSAIRRSAELQKKAAQIYAPKASAGLDAETLEALDREIMCELRSTARTRKGHWVGDRSMYTITKRVRLTWRLAEVQGLRNWGDKCQFARKLVAERIEALAQAGKIHREVRYTPTGLERPGFVVSMFDAEITQADREWLASMHVVLE